MIICKNVVWPTLTQIIVISLCLSKFNGVQSACSDGWECDNGECISDLALCDGKVDCEDKSDEIAENCIHFHETCQTFAFRCAYGACIDGTAKCNGVQDCADNSDELACKERSFQGTCSDSEMQCIKSEECIDDIKICDGKYDCKDHSDESLEVCVDYGCVSFGFQCGNGACISGNAKCNGIIDCVDGSDEAWQLCKTKRKKTNFIGFEPTSSQSPIPRPTPTTKPMSTPDSKPTQLNNCYLPNTPDLQKMIIRLHPTNHTIPLETYVNAFRVIHVECKSKYRFEGQSSLLCKNGDWDHNFPTCSAYCDSSLLNRLSLQAVCGFNFRKCPPKIPADTSISVICAYGYTRPPKSPRSQDLLCLSDGTFNNSPEPCEHECGKIASSSEVLSRGGVPIESRLAPWHVAIYEYNTVYYQYTCSGSIISPSIIISAAHCFWDEANRLIKNYAPYQIIAGQSTSNYSTDQNKSSQIIQVENIYTPPAYRGEGKGELEDIAFLKLKTPLKYSPAVLAICLKEDLRSTVKTYMRSNKEGFINGFGLQNRLERLKMITLSYDDCDEISPPGASVAVDKFCIYNNEGSAVCHGDSGGGFYREYKDPDTNEAKHRLWGVISNTPTTKNGCTRTDKKTYVAITNIFDTPSEFKEKLKAAALEDRKLF